MKRLAAALVAASVLAAPVFAQAPADPVAAAIADTTRPPDDVARDAARKPAVLLAFADVKPGMAVVDWVPGGGYFTRLFADVVGDEGKVYAWVPAELNERL